MELTPLQRPRGRGGWLTAALVTGAVLVAVVAAGRLGMEPGRQPASSPVASAAGDAASHSPPPTPTETTPTPSPVLPVIIPPAGRPAAPPVGLMLHLNRYADGIPAEIDGEEVLRLPDVLAGHAAKSVLIGGWYMGPQCARIGSGLCPYALFGDTPAVAVLPAMSIAIDRTMEFGTGPRILRATLELDPPCRVPAAGCGPRLRAQEFVWSGDPHTDAAPIEAVPLLGALAFAFPQQPLDAFHDLVDCRIPWPGQAYRSQPTYRTGPDGVRMALLFSSVAAREAAEPQIRDARQLLLDGIAGDCLAGTVLLGDPVRWVARDNAMVLVPGESELAYELALAALADARGMSGVEPVDTPGPLDAWVALSRLWQFDRRLDIVPASTLETCRPGLPAEAYALRTRAAHRDGDRLRLLAVFPSRSDRRAFQQASDATQVWLGETCDDDVALQSARWVGHQNVLLQVIGPAEFDDPLLTVLRGFGN